MNQDLAGGIVSWALEAGASAAGIVPLDSLRSSPSHQKEPIVDWSAKSGSVLVLGLAHPGNQPELDWWDGRRGTPGNRGLMDVGETVLARLRAEEGPEAQDLPYHADRGGVFLKDAAVLAGLGVIGRNNLLIAPGLGPRIRLRGVLIRARLPASPGPEFEPLRGVSGPLSQGLSQGGPGRGGICPGPVHAPDGLGPGPRPGPGRSGAWGGPKSLIKYCRLCERACPVGR